MEHELLMRGRAFSFGSQLLSRKPVKIARFWYRWFRRTFNIKVPFLCSVFDSIIILLAGWRWNETSCFPTILLKGRTFVTSVFHFVGLTLVRGDLFSPAL